MQRHSIDKSSSAELSEAINSMFKWYQEAEVCYAYLQDVCDDSGSSTSMEVLNARWFTRGWTLQELIAPKKVEFYDRNWVPLGTKHSLASVITIVTNIPKEVLKDTALLYSTSIAARMSWAARRCCTRPEDIAYCLLGLFGVNMPLLYGEGSRSFLRLQEEIIKISDDQSIFAWTSSAQAHMTALAEHPSNYLNAEDIVPLPRGPTIGPYTMSHRGLSITMPVVQTTAYHGGYKICIALLQCQYAGDYTKQVTISMCETDTQDVYARCPYRGSYVGAMEVDAAQQAKFRTIYIESPWQRSYQRKQEAVIQLSYAEALWKPVQICPAEGVLAQWTEKSKTLRLQRSATAYSHDMAAGFVFQRLKDQCSKCRFLVVAYFPYKSSVTTKITGVKMYQPESDWDWDDWVQRATEDLSSVHVQEIVHPQSTEQRTYCDACEHVTLAWTQGPIVLGQQICRLNIGLQPRGSSRLGKHGFVTVPQPSSRPADSSPPVASMGFSRDDSSI